MSDVAIVGIGMHPFGRHEGVTGMEQGAVAVREACRDAGVEWKDIQFAFGGSSAAGRSAAGQRHGALAKSSLLLFHNVNAASADDDFNTDMYVPVLCRTCRSPMRANTASSSNPRI